MDQEKGLIEFIDRERDIKAQAPVHFIGSYSTKESSWLWGWANPSIEAPLTVDALQTKAHGAEKGKVKLTTAKVTCDQKAAWRLAALSCMVCGQQGVYRGPAGDTMVFMAFCEVSVRKSPG